MPLTIINDKLKTILTQLRLQLENHYEDRLKKLILFGSQARGDAHLYSDIDVLVVLKMEKLFIDLITTANYSAEEFEGVDYMAIGVDFVVT